MFSNGYELPGTAQSSIDWEAMLGPCDATTESTSVRPSGGRRRSTINESENAYLPMMPKSAMRS